MIAVFSLVFVFLTQTFLVYDYFKSVRFAIIKESDAIITEAFREDLNKRNNQFSIISAQARASAEIDDTDEDAVYVDFDMRQLESSGEGVTGKLDIFLHTVVSNFIPMNIHTLDSITANVLRNRSINSNFIVQLVNPETKEVIESSKSITLGSLFVIRSKPLQLDFEGRQALVLMLVNPFVLIIKRMGLMLLSSIVFTIICLLAFVYLRKILAKQKQLVRFKNEFLSNIAHELKRPVASLLANFEMLQMPQIIESETHRDLYVNNSVNSLNELNGTISMIVGLAREEEGLLTLNRKQIKPVDILEDLMSGIIGNRNKQIHFETNFESDDIVINADPVMLTQCFANLIDNAVKYSKADVLIKISLFIKAGMIELNFEDNGIGIPAHKVDTIFQKYSRVDENSKVKGFGIGLNYVKTIVEKHGGNISVSSTEGIGSNFKVVLPIK